MYAWCSTGAHISLSDVNQTDNWVDVLDVSKAASLRCLSLTATGSKTGLAHANCEEKRPFLCEVHIVAEIVPQ